MRFGIRANEIYTTHEHARELERLGIGKVVDVERQNGLVPVKLEGFAFASTDHRYFLLSRGRIYVIERPAVPYYHGELEPEFVVLFDGRIHSLRPIALRGETVPLLRLWGETYYCPIARAEFHLSEAKKECPRCGERLSVVLSTKWFLGKSPVRLGLIHGPEPERLLGFFLRGETEGARVATLDEWRAGR